MKLKISELFESIQGESSFAGFPFFFIRLAGCNLRCSYCDTQYAYNDNYKFIEVEEILNKFRNSGFQNVLITGGEPLIQENVYFLLDEFVNIAKIVMLETNGSILLNRVNNKVTKIVDFKTPSSNMSKSNNFKNIDFLNKTDEVKFVIGNKEDFLWSVSTIKKYNIDAVVDNIHFSPVFKKLAPKTLGEWILEEKINVRLSLQIHKIIDLK